MKKCPQCDSPSIAGPFDHNHLWELEQDVLLYECMRCGYNEKASASTIRPEYLEERLKKMGVNDA